MRVSDFKILCGILLAGFFLPACGRTDAAPPLPVEHAVKQPAGHPPAEATADVYQRLVPLYEVKRPPGPMDWLAHHHEPGQTVAEFLASDPVFPDAKKRYLYLTLIGDFDPARKKIIDRTAEVMEAFYGIPVRWTDPVPLDRIPDSARRVHPQTGDPQVLAPYLLEEILMPAKPDDAFGLIAFTTEDLWPGAGWNFVFGQADRVNRVGVWSIYRNGDPNEGKDAYQLCLRRTIQTGLHEVGHLFSLPHCIYYECLMNGSNHRRESDERPVWLCPVCLRKLNARGRFDLKDRFRKLSELFGGLGFDRERDFYQRAVQQISD